MATTTARLKVRRDIAANWTAADPILETGEIGFEIDTYKIKIGDGSNSWSNLSYFSADGTAGGSASTLSDYYAFGETLSANTLVYIENDGKVYAANEADPNKIEIIGFTTDSGSDDSVLHLIRKRGELEGFSGLTIGQPCFWRDGGIIQSDDLYLVDEYRLFVGVAVDTNKIDVLLMEPVLMYTYDPAITVSTNHSVGDESIVNVDTVPITVTLPSNEGKARKITIRKITSNSGNVTIEPPVGSTIQGEASYIISGEYQEATFEDLSSTNWVVQNQSADPEGTALALSIALG